MGAFFGFAKFVFRPARNHLKPMFHVIADHISEVQHHRATFHEGHIVDAKRRLKRGVFVKVIQNNVRNGIPTQVIHHPHPIAIRFIPKCLNTFNAFLIDEVGGFFEHHRFIDHIRNLRNDDLGLSFMLFDGCFGPDYNPTPSRAKGRLYAFHAVNGPPRRKIGSRNVLHQVIHRNLRIIQIGNNSVGHFGQVVRSHVGSHTHRNTRRAVEQQVGQLGRHHTRLLKRVVEVGLKIDRLLVNITQNLVRNALQTGFGIPHGCG